MAFWVIALYGGTNVVDIYVVVGCHTISWRLCAYHTTEMLVIVLVVLGQERIKVTQYLIIASARRSSLSHTPTKHHTGNGDMLKREWNGWRLNQQIQQRTQWHGTAVSK